MSDETDRQAALNAVKKYTGESKGVNESPKMVGGANDEGASNTVMEEEIKKTAELRGLKIDKDGNLITNEEVEETPQIPDAAPEQSSASGDKGPTRLTLADRLRKAAEERERNK